MMQEFHKITLEEGRTMIRRVGLQLLPNWDIIDVMVFDGVRKEMKTMYIKEEEARRAQKGVKYSEYHVALVIWSLQKKEQVSFL